MGKRIVFTGGSGKAGRHVVPYLLGQGHQVLNIDRTVLDVPGVHTLLTDVTDSGQVFNALSCHFGYEGYEEAGGPKPVDAVVHFAAVPRILMHPDNKTFAVNNEFDYRLLADTDRSVGSRYGVERGPDEIKVVIEFAKA